MCGFSAVLGLQTGLISRHIQPKQHQRISDYRNNRQANISHAVLTELHQTHQRTHQGNAGGKAAYYQQQQKNNGGYIGIRKRDNR